nr:integrase, catalytic region, zinc finger, CCHC-type, peptidase aspartic, catalytic [Tanacetum cinerariifolium]
EPKTYKDALSQSCWIESMQEELNEFERIEVWELVPRPVKVMVITLKWIYKVKLDELGGILKNKARSVVRGYRQEEGIDFEESFALALYGLKQAVRAWYDMLSSFLISQDFSKGSVDPTLFLRRNGNDLLLMSMMGKISFFLGLQISQSPRGIFINQYKYAPESLKKYGFESCDLVDTPMVKKSKLDEDKEGKTVDPSHYHDADHAGCQDTRRSTSGSVQFLEERLISWSLKRQKSAAISKKHGVFSESAPTFAELFKINDLKAQAQAKDTVILKLKEKLRSLNGYVNERNVKREVEEVETLNIELDHKVTKLVAENEHLKQTYKQLYDSIKSLRVRSKEQCDDLINKVTLKSAEVDVAPLVPKLRKNRTAHTDYIRHTQEEAATLREIIESERLLSPLNTSLYYACYPNILWYLDSGCSKHMTGDRSQLVNFVQKFIGTVKFRNDHVAKIMGYGDYQIGNVTISRVYYVEGLGHNLFSVRQFCDSDLEVAFRQHTCFIRNLDGVDLLTGSRGNNLYNLSLQDMMASSLICLLSKASKTKSWLWHRRLSHLNFGAINHLARQGLVRGLPNLKFEKDHLCSACAIGKSTKKTHKPKSEDTNQEKLYLLHMDLCGPMRVESVNGKKGCGNRLFYSKSTNDSENLGKLQPKADIEIFIGYAPTKKAFRIYNRQTRRIVETIHVDFDELTAMASEQRSLGPALIEMTPETISSGLVRTSSLLTSYVLPSRNDWDLLFQPMFDELLNPPPSVVNQAPKVIAPIAEVIPPVNTDSTNSPSLTTVDQDAPSPSKTHTTTEIQSSVIPQDIGDDNLDMEVAHMGNDPLFGVHILEVTSEQSSSRKSP